MKAFLATYTLLIISNLCFGQFFNRIDWKLNRHQLELGLGAANFLGDLGGKDGIGTNDFQDLELPMTRFGFTAGYKYTLYKKLYLRTDFSYGTLAGDDKLTKEPFRANRNLHFRSRIYELAAMLEFEIPINLKRGHIYDIKGVKGWKNRASSFYIFAGIGGFHYNPKAQADSNWVALRPLRTEGQGLNGGPERYRKIGLCIPVGLAISKRITHQMSIGLEANFRFTNSDYIDDVSTEYFNPYEIAIYAPDGYEDVAAYLSNPALGLPQGGLPNKVTAAGQQRGDVNDDDAYMFVLFKMQYLIERNQQVAKKRKSVVSRRGRGKRIVF
jgi:hypothetical protein